MSGYDTPPSTGHRAVPGDYMTSANDYQDARAQDIALNDMIMQLMDMERLPWKAMETTHIQDAMGTDNDNVRADGLLFYARRFSALSLPVAAAGEARNNAKDGSTFYVTVGKSRVVCAKPAESLDLTRTLNVNVAAGLQHYKKQYLQIIHDHVTTNAKLASRDEFKWATLTSMQNIVLFRTQAEAEQLANNLNEFYLVAIDAIRSRLRSEIALLTKVTIADMQPTERKDG